MAEERDPHLLYVCAVCGRVLERRTDLDTGEHIEWLHPFPMRMGAIGESEDHMPVPVPFDELPHPDTRCDFCYEINPQWTLPARSFTHTTPSFEAHGSAGDWAACDACADLLNRGMWSVLIRRAVKAYTERTGDPMEIAEMVIKVTYRNLRKNITGAVYKGTK